MIGIIGAMSAEVEALKAKMSGTVCERISGIEFVRGTLGNKDAVVAQCGIGKVFAAICTEIMIVRFGVDTVINTGVAGTLSDKIGILDFAISSSVVQHDMDTTAIGDAPGLISGINVVNINANASLCALAHKRAQELGNRAICGVIASGDQFINDPEKKSRIRALFNAIACEMEGAAIGQTCYVSGVKFVIIRCISDNASGEADMEYPEMVKIAAERSQMLVEAIVAAI